MKVTPQTPEIPFSEKKFNVEMTGLELAFIKILTGRGFGKTENTLRILNDDIFYAIGIDTDYGSVVENLDNINFGTTDLAKFKENIDKLNK